MEGYRHRGVEARLTGSSVPPGLPRTPRITSSPAGGEKTTYTLTWETETYTPITMYRLQYRERVDDYMVIGVT